MAVSDLTNTKWLWNSSLIRDGSIKYYNINFISNNTNYTTMEIDLEDRYISYNDTTVHTYPDVWIDEVYRTITITGGTDATNTDLINTLTYNATQIVEAGKTQLGTRTITKKMFGTREITKEVVNGVVVYEKQAPSGFSVSIENLANTTGNCFYSLDNGTTWVDIGDSDSDINLTGVTQIMFKVDNPHIADWGIIRSTQLGFNINGENGEATTQNYVLTQNVTDIRASTYYD